MGDLLIDDERRLQQVLAQLHDRLELSALLKALLAQHAVTARTPGSEQRDARFAVVFGILAILRSGRLRSEPADGRQAVVSAMVQQLSGASQFASGL
jgi:hypothetical protein